MIVLKHGMSLSDPLIELSFFNYIELGFMIFVIIALFKLSYVQDEHNNILNKK